jgi:hypothetical protein
VLPDDGARIASSDGLVWEHVPPITSPPITSLNCFSKDLDATEAQITVSVVCVVYLDARANLRLIASDFKPACCGVRGHNATQLLIGAIGDCDVRASKPI